MNAATIVRDMPRSILFLCRGESAVRMDVKSLRGIGITSIAYAVTAEDALNHLEQKLVHTPQAMKAAGFPAGVDMIVCDEQMQCRTTLAFLYELAGYEALRSIPVLVIASSAKSARRYDAVKVPVLERPYTSDQLAETLRRVMSLACKPLAREVFEKAGVKGATPVVRERSARRITTGRPVTTTDLYRQGMGLLKQHEPLEAREYFLQVLDRQEDHLEACLALARTYQMENDTSGVRSALVRAAAACLRKGDQTRAEHIASMLPLGMRNNIFAQEALVRMREGEYRAAALSFLEAGKRHPDQPLHSVIARACLLTTRPEICMSRICESLEGLGHKFTATALRRRLLDYPQCNSGGKGPSWLDRYPRFKEAVSVASYAAWAWKQA